MYKNTIFFIAALFVIACGNNTNKTNTATNIDSVAIKAGVQDISIKIQENPRNAELYFTRGEKYFAADILERAEIDFKDACTLDSTNPNYFYMQARCNYGLNHSLLAAKNYEKAIALAPEFVDAKIKLADLYYITKEHEKSINLANSVLALDKTKAYAYHIKAMNYKDLGDTAKAIINFQKAIEQDNNDFDSYMIMAKILLAQKNKLSLEYINAAIRIRPKDADAYFARATFWQLEKQYKMALMDYKKVIERNPDYYECYYNVGYINFETGFLKEAIHNFDLCVRMMNNYLPAYYMRGLCYEMLKDYPNAKLNYQFVVDNNPQYELAILGLNRVSKK
jgi:tetratricopeptide (TPR) repeat protein